MAQISEPRRLMLSWRPTPRQGHVRTWLERFKLRLSVECHDMEVFDALERGEDRAAERDRRFDSTDFISLLTIDYVSACGTEPEHELTSWALPILEKNVPGVRFWAVRMDAGEPKSYGFRCGKLVKQPWLESGRWHFLPPDKDARHFLDKTSRDMDTRIELDCVIHLKSPHPSTCEICCGEPFSAASADSTTR